MLRTVILLTFWIAFCAGEWTCYRDNEHSVRFRACVQILPMRWTCINDWWRTTFDDTVNCVSDDTVNYVSEDTVNYVSDDTIKHAKHTRMTPIAHPIIPAIVGVIAAVAMILIAWKWELKRRDAERRDAEQREIQRRNDEKKEAQRRQIEWAHAQDWHQNLVFEHRK